MDEIRIFISYAREDEARAKQLYQQLTDAGFQPWLDRERILPGMNWELEIKKALKRSDFVLVCLSATSINKRGFLQLEIKEALEKAKENLEDDVYLIPARLDDCAVPDALSKIHWVNLYEDGGWHLLLKAIEHGLKQRGKTMPTSKPKSDAEEIAAAIISGSVKPRSPLDIWRAFSDPTIENSRSAPAHKSFTDSLNGISLEMIFVPGGSFKMGSPEGKGRSNERPQHDVSVSDFYVGKYQIKQAQWLAVMGKNPSHFKGDSELPVESVSWNDAKQFCEKLSKITGKVYRLPNEAEWEYACRAGTTGDYAGELDAMAWYSKNSGPKTHPVGQKRPNAFGLYDMHGNILEWCEDVWHDNYKNAPVDGSAWLGGGDPSRRVVRGGFMNAFGYVCGSAYRDKIDSSNRNLLLGVRVVISARILTK